MTKFAALSTVIILTNLAPVFANGATTPENKEVFSWREKMRALEKSMSAILIHAATDGGKVTANDQDVANVENIAKIATELEQNYQQAPQKDPSIRLFARLLASDAKLAAQTLRGPSSSYAMNLATGLTQYCIACHTRNSKGVAIQTGWNDPKLASLKPAQLMRYYASTRQFDAALKTAQDVLKGEIDPAGLGTEQERAARIGLAVAVRVKNSPEEAEKIVSSIEGSKNMPLFLRSQAGAWKKQVQSWKAEGKKANEGNPVVRARKLIHQAKGAQEFATDRSQDVLYLRASALLHEALEKNPNDAEATYLLGTTYEVLRPLQLWEVQEFYYLSCIHLKPQSPIAQQCYDRYEESIYLGYTGSGGTDIPGEIQKRLKDLRELAYSKPKPRAPLQ